MSRRQDREGVPRCAYQGHVNKTIWEAQERVGLDPRGWPIPCTVVEGWDNLNLAIWWLRYRMLVLKPRSDYERSEARRSFWFHLFRAKSCPAPNLP